LQGSPRLPLRMPAALYIASGPLFGKTASHACCRLQATYTV
jgi:hypothetical protein